MTKLTRYLLWAYVFTVPWDNFALPLLGSISRAFGLAVVGAAVLTSAVRGRIRTPDAILCFAIAFAAWNALSMLWTLSYPNTLRVTITTTQLVASVFVLREFVRTREHVEQLLVALCLGLMVPLAALLNNFRLGQTINIWQTRYSGLGINADGVGLLLVLGFPIGWYLLMLHRRGAVRIAALAYVLVAPVGLLLTATRGAFVAGFAALAIIPLTLNRRLVRAYVVTAILLVGSAVAALAFVPQYNFDRLLSTSTEITEGGTLTGRTIIWKAGLQAFPERPILGAGAGAYGEAVQAYLANTKGVSAHNLAIGLLVEQGVVGLALFAGVLGACAWTALHQPAPHRTLWSLLVLTWAIGGLSGNPELMKFTWTLFGLVSAQSGLSTTSTAVRARESTARTPRRSLRTATI
jgi:O-antigen ligase